MKLKIVYDTWVENGCCSASQLAVVLSRMGFPCTEAIAAQKLNQAAVANASGMLYPGQGKPVVSPAMKVRQVVPGHRNRG